MDPPCSSLTFEDLEGAAAEQKVAVTYSRSHDTRANDTRAKMINEASRWYQTIIIIKLLFSSKTTVGSKRVILKVANLLSPRRYQPKTHHVFTSGAATKPKERLQIQQVCIPVDNVGDPDNINLCRR